MQISNLGDYPNLADTVADRGWNAWWVDSGVPVSQYRAHLEPMARGADFPFCLVAHEAGNYAGSVLVIENDLTARPQYTPWIAALWVEPERRRQGIGTNLLTAASAQAAKLGHPRCYLCATSDKGGYYLARGFRQLESDVSGLDVFLMEQ